MESSSAGEVSGILTVVVIVIVVLVAVGGAFALGLGPLGGAGDGEATPTPADTPTPAATPTPADTPTPAPTDAVDTQSGEETAENRPPFGFEIVDMEECGTTCRDVTVTLHNNQDQSASDVSVTTRIYAGNSTDESDQIWSGDEEIGDMEASGSATRTQRVELSTSEAFDVQRNDGWITIHTTIESEESTFTFEDRRNVL